MFALVDDADYADLSRRRWFAQKGPRTFYAVCNTTVDGKRKTARMHRILVGDAATGLQVDHRDGDGLNNQRANLRVCTSADNQHNQRTRKDNVTGFKGVSAPIAMRNGANKYRAQIKFNGKQIHLGRFPTAEQAHAVYCEAAKRLHGEFARFA